MRERLIKGLLQVYRAQGHDSVEVRDNGNNHFHFFCTTCLTPCYGEDPLLEHLKGNLHSRRYAAAKATLLGPNSWPFNDGVLFFSDTNERNHQLALADGKEKYRIPLLTDHSCIDEIHSPNGSELQLVPCGHGEAASANENASARRVPNTKERYSSMECCVDRQLHRNGNGATMGETVEAVEESSSIIIPSVVHKGVVLDICAQFIGYGGIGAKINESNQIQKIWCAWLGKESIEGGQVSVGESEFAVVTFSYSHDLGRASIETESTGLLMDTQEDDNDDKAIKVRENLIDYFDSSKACCGTSDDSNEVLFSKFVKKNSLVLVPTVEDKKLHIMKSGTSHRARRKEERRRQKMASERCCSVCNQKMLPGKDVAAFLNTKTGKLACSSRNTHGAFHLFHISCLLHWILYCESRVWTADSRVSGKGRSVCKSRKVNGRRGKRKRDANERPSEPSITSVFCPDCQGTGVVVKEDELESPKFLLHQMFTHTINTLQAHKKWMSEPEILKNCSTGLFFDSITNNQEKAVRLKRISFYKIDNM